MQYRVIESDSVAGLQSLVEDALAQGWSLQGGVALVGFRFAQAVMRKIAKPSK